MKIYLYVFSILCILLSILSAEETKQFTIKGFYNFPSVVNMNTSTDSSFFGKLTTESDTSISGGFGVGVEAIMKKIKNVDIIGGGSLMFQRNGIDFKGNVESNTDVRDITFEIKSVYAKIRYLFNPEKFSSFYVAGKAAYNMVDIHSLSLGGRAKFGNGIGFGFSAGILYENDFDIELAVDNITGTARNDLHIPLIGIDNGGNVIPAGVITESLKGTYSLNNISLSVGYRF